MEANLSPSSSATLCLWLAQVSYWHIYVRLLYFVKWIYLFTLHTAGLAMVKFLKSGPCRIMKGFFFKLWKVIKNDIFELLSSQEDKSVCVQDKTRMQHLTIFHSWPRWKRWSGALYPHLHLHLWDAWSQGGLAQADVTSHTGRADDHKVVRGKRQMLRKCFNLWYVQGCHLGGLLYLATVSCCHHFTQPSL